MNEIDRLVGVVSFKDLGTIHVSRESRRLTFDVRGCKYDLICVILDSEDDYTIEFWSGPTSDIVRGVSRNDLAMVIAIWTGIPEATNVVSLDSPPQAS